MAFINKRTLWISAGVFSGLATAFCVSELRRILREKCTREPLSRLEDSIRLEDLEVLTRSPNIPLKRSAEQLLLERAMRKKNLHFIMKACRSKDETQVLKGVTVLGVLVKSPEFRERLVQSGVLETLASCLVYSYLPGYRNLAGSSGLDVHLQKLASASVFDLLCDEDANKARIVSANPYFIAAVLQIMVNTTSKEVMRWCILITHQLTLCDSVRADLVANTAVPVVSKMLVKNIGDANLMRLCLQMLVTFANGSEEEVEILKVIGEYDVFVPAVVSLRAEDSDLIYWAAALLHEFAMKDICKASICGTPNFIKSLNGVLSASESILQRIVLRILSFLCVGNPSFRSAVLQSSSLLVRLPVCFASGDKDVVHWAVVLLHDLLLSAGNPDASRAVADQVLTAAPDIIRSLIPLAFRKESNLLIRLVAENLGFFCAIESLQYRILEDRVLKAVLMFATSDDQDLQYWATALLLNMSMMSDEMKEEMIRLGGMKPLIELAISDSQQPQIAAQAAKTLVMLGFIDKQIPVSLKAAGCKQGNFASVIIDNREYCVNKPGINIVVLDFLTFKVTDSVAFDPSQEPGAVALVVEFLHMIPLSALVLIAVKEEGGWCMTEELNEALLELGIENAEFREGELWVYFGQKKKGNGEQLAIHRGCGQVSLQTTLWLGRLVKGQVQVNILLPVIEVLMSTPASVAISKASELELLTILARHNEHKQVMVNAPDLLQYMADLVWSMSVLTADQLRANPMALAHCIGAVKIVAAISISEHHHDNLAQAGVLSAILSLLYRISDVRITWIERQAARKANALTDTAGQGGAHNHACVGTPVQETSVLPAKVELTASGLRSPVGAQLEEVSFDDRRPGSSQAAPAPEVSSEDRRDGTSRAPPVSSKASDGQEEFDDTFSSLTCLAVTTLYNCTSLFSGSEYSRETLLQSGALQVMWCTLFTSSEATVARVCLAIEALLNTFGCFSMLERYYPEHVVELDERVKTSALLLSADRLEASNTNWTFESVRATFCIGRSMYHAAPYPAGWYYEVTLKSTGILQIGWQTDDCRYGPEKGVGIGDNNNSCAFDGGRRKIWNGPPGEQHNNDYGVEWKVDDVLSCLFSWNGDVSFWLNGSNMGVAFQELNSAVNWYPAASLAMDQHCIFNFGSKPFRYQMPEGYVAVSHVVTHSVKKLPMRLSSCWTPISGSFDSIVEEDEELEEDSGPLEPEDGNEPEAPEDEFDKFPSLGPMELSMREEKEPHQGAAFSPAESPTAALMFDSLTTVSPNSTLQDTPVRELGPAEERPSCTCDPDGRSKITSTPFGVAPRTPLVFGPTPRQMRPVPFSPGESLAASFAVPSMPCLYFEAELKNSSSRIKQMGFFDVDTKEKIFCDIHDGQLLLPQSPHTAPSLTQKECHRAPDVVGCGIMWPVGLVIFTIDGVGTGKFYQFPSNKPLVIQHMLPYVSCSRIRCNYGQRPFLFEHANLEEVRFAAASVLHERDVCNGVKLHEENAH